MKNISCRDRENSREARTAFALSKYSYKMLPYIKDLFSIESKILRPWGLWVIILILVDLERILLGCEIKGVIFLEPAEIYISLLSLRSGFQPLMELRSVRPVRVRRLFGTYINSGSLFSSFFKKVSLSSAPCRAALHMDCRSLNTFSVSRIIFF